MMTEMFDNPTDSYIGEFQSFQFGVDEDTPPNSVIVIGSLIGVTREPFLSGTVGVAYMGQSYGVFSLPKVAEAVRGSQAFWDTKTKNVVFAESENTVEIGFVWRDADAEESFVQVALF